MANISTDLTARAIALINEEGTEESRRLTVAMFKGLPSSLALIPAEYRERVYQIIYGLE